MSMQTPYVSAIADVKPINVQSHFSAMAYERDVAILPIKLTLSSGALAAQQCTRRAFAEDQGDNVIRLYIPPCRPGSVHLALQVGTVDYSASGSGYIDIDFGSTLTGDYVGVLFIRQSKDFGIETVTNGSTPVARPKSVPSKGLYPAYGLIPGLTVFSLRFTLDASGDYVPGSAEGLPAFNIVHNGAGSWSIYSSHAFNDSFVFLVSSTVGTFSAEKGDANEIELTASADPNTAEITIFAVGSISKAGIDHALTVLTAAPRSSKREVFPLMSPFRGMVIAPFRLVVNGSGAIIAAGSFAPATIKISKATGDLRFDVGQSISDLTHVALRKASTVYAATKTNLATTGRLHFTLGDAAASSVLSGMMLLSSSARR